MSEEKTQLRSIRAFLFDVDKTLTNSRGEVTQRTQQALQQLAQKEYSLGVCTGRGFARVQNDILPLFPKESLHIVSGGAEVVRSTGERVFSLHLSEQQKNELIQAAQDHGVEFLFDAGAATYGSPRFVTDHHVAPYQQCPETTIPNFVAYYLTESFRAWIAEQKEFEVIEHESTWLKTTLFDITVRGVNKARGVMEWARLQNLEPDQIAGFGDSYNDLSFLSAVGWSVALGNAVPELQELAQQVIGPTDEDGLAQYLEENWLR